MSYLPPEQAKRRPHANCDCCGRHGRVLGLTLRGVSSEVCAPCFDRLVCEYKVERFGTNSPELEIPVDTSEFSKADPASETVVARIKSIRSAA